MTESESESIPFDFESANNALRQLWKDQIITKQEYRSAILNLISWGTGMTLSFHEYRGKLLE